MIFLASVLFVSATKNWITSFPLDTNALSNKQFQNLMWGGKNI